MSPACPICGGPSTPHHPEAGRLYHRCAACPFVFLHPAPSHDELEALYLEEQGATFHHAAEIAAAHEKRLEARRRYGLVRGALDRAPARSALEIGCGAGYFLELLVREGWSASGVELAEAYRTHAREALKLDVGRERPDGPFGAILLFDVLSHLPDPDAELRAFARALHPGGVLVLETGNAAEIPAHRIGKLGAPDHVWHFSEAALRTVLGRAGFVDVRVRRRNVEWQRGVLAGMGRLRRKAAPKPSAAPSGPAKPAPPPGLKRRILDRVLLGLRFDAGRWLADLEHACTLFVTARRRAP